MNTFLMFGLVLLIELSLCTVITYFMSRLLKVSGVTFRRTFFIVILSSLASAIILFTLNFIGLGNLAGLVSIVVYFAIFGFLYKKYYFVSWKKSLGIFVLIGIVGTLLALTVSLPLRMYVFEPFVVNGQSMSPQFNHGDLLFIDKLDKNYQRDDVVVFEYKNAYIIKRIIGLPSEKISLNNGQLSIDGNIFNDKFIRGQIVGNIDITLNADEYFVLGDNMASSSVDSTNIGPVKVSDIVGKVSAE